MAVVCRTMCGEILVWDNDGFAFRAWLKMTRSCHVTPERVSERPNRFESNGASSDSRLVAIHCRNARRVSAQRGTARSLPGSSTWRQSPALTSQTRTLISSETRAPVLYRRRSSR